MFDFLRFVQDHRVPYLTEGHHHCHEGWVQTHCPLCSSGGTGFHLGFSLERGNLNCWRCGPVKIIDFIRSITRTSVERAKGLRMEYEGKGGGGELKLPRKLLHSPFTKPPIGLGPLNTRHLKYLHGRGLTHLKRLVEIWELQGTCQFSLEWNWRVVAPVRKADGSLVAYVGRSILSGVTPKYRVTEEKDCGLDPRGLLYGIHKVPGEAVLIVEGPGDVWNMGPGAVATLGTSWRSEQMNQLRKFKHRYVMYDPERKAQERASKLAEALSLFPGETEVIDGLKSDPGSLPQREVLKIQKELQFGGRS